MFDLKKSIQCYTPFRVKKKKGKKRIKRLKVSPGIMLLISTECSTATGNCRFTRSGICLGYRSPKILAFNSNLTADCLGGPSLPKNASPDINDADGNPGSSAS